MAKRRKTHLRKGERVHEYLKFDGTTGYVVKRIKKQSGTTHKIPDQKLRALPPGERESKDGNLYWETRRNRSDRQPSKRL